MKECFECGIKSSSVEDHHVVPKSLGGRMTVPLCLSCHSKIHDRDFLTHRALQIQGINRAKKQGKYRGRKPGTTKVKPERASYFRGLGMSVEQISIQLGVSRNTVFRYLRQSIR